MTAPRRGAASLHHVALGTADVAALASFYGELLDLPEYARHHYADGRLRSIWLDLSGTWLMIEHTEEPHRAVAGVGAGPFLLAFRAERGERLRYEQKLAELARAIESRTAFTSYSRDPDGNRLAFSEYPAEAS